MPDRWSQARVGWTILIAAAVLAVASLSADRLTDGPAEFGGLQQLGVILASLAAVIGVRLASGSWEATAVAGVLGALVISRIPTLDQLLQEAHAFRQTQTAYTAVLFDEEGIDLLHPKLPVLGPPFEVPFEFPLFQALALLPLKLGLPADSALRLTGLACFVATALLLYGLLRHVGGGAGDADRRAVAIGGLIAFCASPFALLWSRTSMIEYLATAGAVGFAWMTIRWREERRPTHAALALGAGSVAMLVKPTTGIFWILPALAWRTPDARSFSEWRRSLLSPTLVAIVAIPVALGLLWTQHADAIKAGQEATAWMTSANLEGWNFGTLEQRESLANWGTIWNRLADFIIGPALALLPLTAWAAWHSGQRPFWGAIALALVLPPAVFFNLYVAHDYYLVAVTPAAAALVGLGAGWLWSRLPSARARAAVAACAGALIFWTIDAAGPYWKAVDRVETGAALVFAKPLKQATAPDEQVMVVGLHGWSPDVLYYARREGLTLPGVGFIRPDFLREQRDRYRVLLSANPTEDQLPEVLAQWPWIGVIGPRLYSMGERPEDIPGSAITATDDLSAVVGSRRAGEGLKKRRTIRCGGTLDTSIPAGRRGTWLRVNATPNALIEIDNLSPIPARRVLAVAPRGRNLSLNCTGERPVTVHPVADAPPLVRCAPPRPFRWRNCG